MNYKVIVSMFLTLCLFAGLTSCSDDEKKEAVTEYDGTYKGETYISGTSIGSWEMTITNGTATGEYSQAGEVASIQGSVNKGGDLNVNISFGDGSKVQVSATISNGNISGTWTNDEGESGTISGTKDSDPTPSNSKYDGHYAGQANADGIVIGSWQISISGGNVSGNFNGDGENAGLNGTVDANGILNLTADFGEGYTVVINAVISGENINGTWSNEDGETGTITGTKDNSGNPTNAYDGNYAGEALMDGMTIGTWQIMISSTQISGNYSQDGENADINGSVSTDGKLTFQIITFTDEVMATVNAAINGENISGTWSNSEGESGTLSGSKI